MRKGLSTSFSGGVKNKIAITRIVLFWPNGNRNNNNQNNNNRVRPISASLMYME